MKQRKVRNVKKVSPDHRLVVGDVELPSMAELVKHIIAYRGDLSNLRKDTLFTNATKDMLEHIGYVFLKDPYLSDHELSLSPADLDTACGKEYGSFLAVNTLKAEGGVDVVCVDKRYLDQYTDLHTELAARLVDTLHPQEFARFEKDIVSAPSKVSRLRRFMKWAARFAAQGITMTVLWMALAALASGRPETSNQLLVLATGAAVLSMFSYGATKAGERVSRLGKK